MKELNLKEALEVAYHKTKTKSELMEKLKAAGGEYFAESAGGNGVFIVNKYGILEGIGFDIFGKVKVWKNTMYGTYEVNDIKHGDVSPVVHIAPPGVK